MQINKKILFLILPVIVLLPTLASAQTVQDLVDGAVQTMLYIASGVVVILWLVTGLLFLTAQGAPEKLKSARTALFAAVAGTIIVIVASSAITFVKSAFHI